MDGPFELLKFADPASLADAVATRWLAEIAANPTTEPLVAISGGRISRLFFDALAAKGQGNAALLRAHFFWADERCVPPEDPESNYRLARERFLNPLGIPAAQIHRIRAEVDRNYATAEAEAELCRLAPLTAEGQPVLDHVFLGMGEDGHIASLFPFEGDSFLEDSAVYRVVSAPKPPPLRVTLNYRALAAAKSVWMLASGVGKEAALKAALAGPGNPFGRFLRLRKNVRIFTDIPV